MKAKLLQAALKVIPDGDLLVNVVSRRVRQLSQGHRPLVAFSPGMQLADLALTEIIDGKLTFELTPGMNGVNRPKEITHLFPVERVKKAA